ncbi:hypothetical protein KKF11_01575 [Patescibacteria group bacterium]|nr:hypothetical protein [Patescibacteria group bacterium]
MIIKKVLAYEETLPKIGGSEGFGPFGLIPEAGENVGTAASAFAQIISNIIGVITIIAGIWFIFAFILGAFSYLTAGGDKAKIEEATKKITQGVIGLVIVVAAYALISLLGSILGFNFLNVGPLIQQLSP